MIIYHVFTIYQVLQEHKQIHLNPTARFWRRRRLTVKVVPRLHSLLCPHTAWCDFSHQEVESLFHFHPLTWDKCFDFFWPEKWIRDDNPVPILSLDLRIPCSTHFLRVLLLYENKPGVASWRMRSPLEKSHLSQSHPKPASYPADHSHKWAKISQASSDQQNHPGDS